MITIPDGGFALLSVRERMLAPGDSADTSTPDAGTRVTLDVPLVRDPLTAETAGREDGEDARAPVA